MKLLAMSDMEDGRVYSEHLLENYGQADVVLGCGDLPYGYLEFVVSVLNRPVLYVHGNHDPMPQHTASGGVKFGPEGCDPLDDRIRKVNDALFVGLGGSIQYSGRSGYQFTENQMRWRVARLLPGLLANRLRYGRYVDVLVTHSPPFGIHDGSDPAHTGFRVFRWLIAAVQPRLVLHGHLHDARQQTTRIGKTQVMGVFPVRMIDLEM